MLCKVNSATCGGAASAPSEEGAGAPKGFRGATEGEIPRACCLHRGIDEHRVKKRSFAFAIVYIKCFRTYSVYLSLRHGVFILYTPCHRCPLAVSRSCFGYSLSHLRTAAACLSRCIRHRRRSKAKPLRGRRGRSRAVHRIAKGQTTVKPAVGGLPSSVTVQRKSAAPRHLPPRGRLSASPQSLAKTTESSPKGLLIFKRKE